MNRLIVAVTGTPGTGKTEFAKRLARRIRGSSLIEINSVVNRYKLYSKKDRFGTKIVNLGELNIKLGSELKRSKGTVTIVVGHLAPELRFRCDVAVVTRCGLVELSKRLEKRKYKRDKAAENLVAEAVDYCGIKMQKRCRKTYEVETGAEKSTTISYIVALAKGKDRKEPKRREITKLSDVAELVEHGNRYGL